MIYPIIPCPKPRQTVSDKWKKRPSVLRYRAFADECRLRRVSIPESGATVIFRIPMPPSWSMKKRRQMDGKPHQQKPDVDNILKAILDAVYASDAGVWDIRVVKLWSDEGSIEVICG